ncbi:MAG: aminotransferase class V-fold PLP-dependent enzyme [Microthrixaceae bacterium]|nr:aspartate aminotransferase family protein [Microthrixaceae bacterium]MCO5312866.1 aminotransferase class V-fold PLP-dependent enzyme [Microthrixaceae bacterium]
MTESLESPPAFPQHGRSADDILSEVAELRPHDIDWRSGKAFSLVYNYDDPELEHLQEQVALSFLHENALNPFRYRSLLQMETEVIGYAKALVGAQAGSLSSGGTESIFLAVYTAREHARASGNTAPTLLCTDTAHPAFTKACHYLGVTEIRLAHGPDGRAVPSAYREAIDDRTAIVVASTPCYPFGVIDPVTEIAAVALDAGVLCHVDACLGGWLLPWWERLGRNVEPWDFRVPGVTSMSADIHKYGYTFKGASVVLYADPDLYQRQIFMFDDWPGGLYASASSAGTRPGPPIASAWATINHLGADGYLRLAARVADATDRMIAGISAIDGLEVFSNPDMSVFEFGSTVHDMDGICDRMDDRGWNLDRQQGGLHLMLAPGHDKVVDAFCADLAEAASDHAPARGAGHTYGGVV